MKWIKTLLFFSFMACLAQQVYAQANPCIYTLDLKDQLGDGWNGAQLEVRINAKATVYTLTNGSAARHFLTLNNAFGTSRKILDNMKMLLTYVK